MILLSGQFTPGLSAEGIVLTQPALRAERGDFGHHFIAIAMFFLAFSSLIGNYAVGGGNVAIIPNHPALVSAFRIPVLATVYFGATASVPLVWKMGDLSEAFMAIINLIAILLPSPVALRAIRDFEPQTRSSDTAPRFSRDAIAGLSARLAKDVW